MKVSKVLHHVEDFLIFNDRCSGQPSELSDTWQINFRKIVEHNPILTPLEETQWKCPVRNELIRWEEKDVFNPAAVVRDNTVYLLYRAEDKVVVFVIVLFKSCSSSAPRALSEEDIVAIRRRKDGYTVEIRHKGFSHQWRLFIASRYCF